MKEKNKISELLDRLHQNKLSKKESEHLFSRFRDENPNDDELNEFYLSEWEKSTTVGELPSSGEIWKKTANQLGIYTKNTKNGMKKIYQLSFMKYAAVFIVAFLSAWMLRSIMWNKHAIEPKDQYNSIISVSNGSKSDIQLPDGSVVKLNSGSTLIYPSSFEADNRTVKLEGEGFFTIRKDSLRPFYVNTSNISVKVLGTVFNVKSYADENTIETILVSGAVAIYNGLKASGKSLYEKPAAMLKPNERATYIKNISKAKSKISYQSGQGQKQTNLIIDKLTDAGTYIAWKDNILKFDNEKFDSIIRRLERWYGVKIDLKYPELNNERFSGQFDSETLEQALNAIAITEPFAFDIKKNTVIIYKKK